MQTRVKATITNPVLPLSLAKTRAVQVLKPTSLVQYLYAESTGAPANYSSNGGVLPMGALIGMLTNSGNSVAPYYVYAIEQGYGDRKEVMALLGYCLKVGANLETGADNATSEDPMPKYYSPLFKEGKILLKKAVDVVGSIPDYMNLQGIRALLSKDIMSGIGLRIGNDVGMFPAKTPILRLPLSLYGKLVAALKGIKVEVEVSVVGSAISEAINLFPFIYLKAQVTEAVSFSYDFSSVVDLFADADGKTHEATQAVVKTTPASVITGYENVLESLKESGTAVGVAMSLVASEDDDEQNEAIDQMRSSAFLAMAEARAAAVQFIRDVIDSGDVEALITYELAKSVERYGLFKYVVEIFRMGTMILEGKTPDECAAECTVDFYDIQDQALEVAENGFYMNESEGTMFKVEPHAMFKTLNPFAFGLSKIPAARKVGNKWEPILENTINGEPVYQWLAEAECNILGLDYLQADDNKSKFFSLNNTFRGIGVVRNAKTKVFEITDKSKESGAEFIMEFAPVGKASCTAKWRIRDGVEDPIKVGKRLAVAGVTFQGGIYMPRYEVKMLPELRSTKADGTKTDAHEGRIFVHPVMIYGENWGKRYTAPQILSTGRAFSKEWGLIKGIVEVNEDYPEDTILFTEGCNKSKEIEVLVESPWLLYSHKSNKEGARTSFCFLTQPNVIKEASDHFITTAYFTAADKTNNISESSRNGLPCVSLAARVAAKAIGNANNLSQCKFPLFELGVQKLYVRGRTSYDMAIDGVEINGSVCIVDPEVYEAIAACCGGADSDDVYYVEKVEGGYQFRRDPNIGIEVYFLEVV